MFSAALRMAAHIPRKVRAAFVEEVRWPIYVLAQHPYYSPIVVTKPSSTSCRVPCMGQVHTVPLHGKSQ